MEKPLWAIYKSMLNFWITADVNRTCLTLPWQTAIQKTDFGQKWSKTSVKSTFISDFNPFVNLLLWLLVEKIASIMLKNGDHLQKSWSMIRIQGVQGSRPALSRRYDYLRYRLNFIMMMVYWQSSKVNRSGPGGEWKT